MDDVEVGVAEVLLVSEERGEEAIRFLSCEGEDQDPVEEPRTVVQ